MDRKFPAATHVEAADEGRGGLIEPTLVQLREADAGEGAGERERAIDPTSRSPGHAGRGERLLEAPQLRQGRGIQ